MKQKEFLTKLQALDIQDGHLTDDDASALIQVAQQAASPKCNFLEIGCWKGKSTACLVAVAVKQNGLVWTVDNFKGSPSTMEETIATRTDVFTIFKRNMKLINAWDSIVPLIGDYRTVMSVLPYNYFKLIYIDANNRYEEMKFLLDSLRKRMHPRGIICGRNLLYDYPDRKTFVDEEIQKEYSKKYMLHPGIIKAVYETFKGGYKRIPNSTVWYYKKKS